MTSVGETEGPLIKAIIYAVKPRKKGLSAVTQRTAGGQQRAGHLYQAGTARAY